MKKKNMKRRDSRKESFAAEEGAPNSFGKDRTKRVPYEKRKNNKPFEGKNRRESVSEVKNKEVTVESAAKEKASLVEQENREETVVPPVETKEEEKIITPEETKEEEYEAIVLIPTDSMPPVQNEEEKTEESAQTETSEEKTESFDELPAETPAEPDTDTEEKPEITEKPELEQSTEVLSYEKYMVGSLKDLESEKYYIQIATLSIDANIMEIVNKYSKNYPITIVPMAGGIRKQIMVGPLSVDEYAVVLERFRSYGYKDAFLRKIK